MVAHAASYNQAVYRGRNDDGLETAATWIAAENTDWSQQADTLFRVRFKVEQTVSNANADLTKAFKVKVSHNGGAFNDAGGQGTTTQPVRFADSTHLTDDEATTEQLTSLQPFIGGKVIEVPPSGSITFTESSRSDTEIEAVLEIVGSNVSVDDTLVLRIYESNDTALATYTEAPTVTVAGAAQPVVVQAAPASATSQAQAVTPVLAAVAIQASPAALTTTAQTVNPTQAALATQASPATLTVAAQTVNPVVSGAPVAVQAVPATLSTAAQTVTPTQAALVVTADPALLTTTGQATSPQQASLAVSAAPATVTTTASVVDSQVTSQGVTVEAAPATLTTTAQAVTPTVAAFTVQADPATLTATGQVTDPIVAGEPVVVQAAPASITTAAQTANVVRAALTIQADPAVVSTTAQALVPAFDALVLQAVAATVNPAASAVLGIEGEKRKRTEGSGVLVGSTEASKIGSGFLEGSKV